MLRYIDVNKIKLVGDTFKNADGDTLVSLSDMRRAIEQTPTADVVEVKHGYWKKRTVYPMGYNCSECNNPETHKSPFCRLCGAKMDGERKMRGNEKQSGFSQR